MCSAVMKNPDKVIYALMVAMAQSPMTDQEISDFLDAMCNMLKDREQKKGIKND